MMTETYFYLIQVANLRRLAERLRAACLMTEAVLYELKAERIEMRARP